MEETLVMMNTGGCPYHLSRLSDAVGRQELGVAQQSQRAGQGWASHSRCGHIYLGVLTVLWC